MKIVIANQEYTIPDDKAILICASYRTGSSALLALIQQQTGLPALGEPFHWIREENTYIKDYLGKPCLLKIMPNHDIDDEVKQILFDTSFKIGIYRRDVIAQGFSFFVAQRTDVWAIKDKTTEYPHPKLMKYPWGNYMADHMINCHKKYKTDYRPHLDLEFVYEDILDDLSKTDHEVVPKHPDYDEFYAIITRNLINNNLPTTND